jgi:hypothetical protein
MRAGRQRKTASGAWATSFAIAMGGIATIGLPVSESVGAALSCPNTAVQVGPSAGLPDCRAYEQVSPLDKGGFAAYPSQSTPVALSLSGEALAYFNFSAFPGAEGNTALYAAHVSTRTSGGWQTQEWTPRVPKAEVLKGYKVNYAFSDDLSQAVVQVPLIPLAPESIPYANNLFLRHPDGTYSLINSAVPAHSVEELCGLEKLPSCWVFDDVSAFAGASTDFRRVIFESNAQLTPEAPPTASLYESFSGHVRLVGVLPDHMPAASSTAGAGSSILYQSGSSEVDRVVEHAISQDGSHVIFQAPSDGGPPDTEQLGDTEIYDRVGGTETLELSAPAPEATPAVTTAEPATFQAASTDGTRVFFSSSAELTTQSNTGASNNSEDLYEYDLETGQLTDLTIDVNPADTASGAMVQGVVGISQDGSYVYFVASGQLGNEGVSGQPNLYVIHNREKPIHIATLSREGSCNSSAIEYADSCNWSPFPVVRAVYVTPDGKHMAFMSTNSIPTVNFPTGYNNIDQETGKADSEVYEYSSPGRPEGTGHLVCASCDQTGTQPLGNALIGGLSSSGNPVTEGRVAVTSLSTPFSRVRALTDNGQRLFYAAPASLATPYTSVYEYEQLGVGSCENAHGCQNLISNAGSNEADYFLGASSDGNNLYFATSNRLTSTDEDNLRDVYDARVDGGFPPPDVHPRCENKCAQPGPEQEDARLSTDVLGLPGNLPALSPAPAKRCKKGFKLTHGKCLRLKKKKHKKQRKSPRGIRSAR